MAGVVAAAGPARTPSLPLGEGADRKATFAAAGHRMNAILDFAEYIVQGLLQLILFVVIAYAILSWLIAFNVVNLRNRMVWQVSRFLEAVARPLLRPFQRLLPTLGGMDFSPILLFLVIGGVQRFLIPALFGWLHRLAEGPTVI
jgi:YggT family protein